MKKGIASRVKPVVEAYIRCGSMVSSEPSPSPMKKVDGRQSHGHGDGQIDQDEHQQER